MLSASGVSIRIPPFVFTIASPYEVVADGVKKLYSDFEVVDPECTFVDFHVAVVKDRRFPKATCVFELDGIRPFTPLAAGEAFAFLEWGMNWCVTGYCHTLVTIHSAVLERDGRALILPAPPGSGKSTLCAALMQHGWRLLSDEMALLDPLTGMVTPAPRPVSLKNQSIAVMQKRAPHAVFGPVARDTMKGTVAHMRVPQKSLEQASVPALPAWLVFPKYQSGAALEVAARPKAGSLMRLSENSFNHHVHGRRGFDAMADLVDRSDCYDLTYSQLDEALEWLGKLSLPTT